MSEPELQWDDVEIGSETVSEDDINDAESMGRVPPGRWLCTCVESTPKQRKGDKYNYVAATLKWKIDKALEVKGAVVPEDKQDDFEGRFIFDDIRMEHVEEKDGWRKRRILIARRTGLINESSDEITKEMWAKGIVGKQVVLTTEDQEYDDPRTGEKKVARGRVAFSGYDYPPKGETVSADSFDDI